MILFLSPQWGQLLREKICVCTKTKFFPLRVEPFGWLYCPESKLEVLKVIL